MVFSSKYFSGTTGLMTCSMRSAAICFCWSNSCWYRCCCCSCCCQGMVLWMTIEFAPVGLHWSCTSVCFVVSPSARVEALPLAASLASRSSFISAQAAACRCAVALLCTRIDDELRPLGRVEKRHHELLERGKVNPRHRQAHGEQDADRLL